MGILGEVSGEDHNRIFISFLGVSFTILMHQNECVNRGAWVRVILWFKNVTEEVPGPRWVCPSKVWNVPGVSSLQPVGRMRLRMAVNVAQHNIVIYLKHYEIFVCVITVAVSLMCLECL